MNRREECSDILTETPPPALEYSVRRARSRYKRSKVGKWCGIPVASLAGVAAAFILLVNTSIPFARACGGVPILKELAATVAFSPSLKAAVENDYVQPMGDSQTVNGVTMTVEYVIVDQKQVNIFFSLKSEAYPGLLYGDPDFLTAEGKRFEATSYGGGVPQKGELNCTTMDFIDGDVPGGLEFIYKVQKPTGDANGMATAPAPYASLDDETPEYDPEYIAEFSFHLAFNPAFTEAGTTYTLNAPFALDGQAFTAESVEVYPSHVRLNVTPEVGNAAALKSLRFYLTDEKGREYQPISNGITATGSAEDDGMTSFRLESSYFDRAEHLIIHITGATWLDKDRAFVNVDIQNGKAIDPMPQGVRLLSAQREGKHVRVVLAAELGGEGGTAPVRTASYSVSSWTYRDPDEGEHRFDSMSHTGGWHATDERPGVDGVPEGCFTEEFVLRDYPWDTVELGMVFSRYTTLDAPIAVAIK